MLRILAIAPNEGLALSIREVSQHRSHIHTVVKIGDLTEALEIVQSIPEESYDLILSRGGTAKLLAQSCQKPVIEIHSSIYDLLRAIRLVGSYGDCFAVVGFQNTTRNIETILELVRRPVKVITITSETEAAACLERLKKEEYSVIIGDTVAIRQAHALNMNGILISSGTESVEAAFDEAETLFRHISLLSQENMMLHSTLSQQGISCLVLGNNQQVLLNSGLFQEEAFLQKASVLYRKAAEQKASTVFRRINGRTYEISILPTFYMEQSCLQMTLIEKLPVWNNKFLQYEENKEANGFHDNIGAMQEVVQQANGILSNLTSSLILAEEGCDLSALLPALIQSDSFGSWPQLIINCSQMTDSCWRMLLEKENSPLNENHRILRLEHPEKLTNAQQHQWLEYAHVSRLATRCKLIYVLSPAAQETPLLHFLLQSSCFTFQVPPLRERKSDIPILASLLTGHFNYCFSKQIIGFAPDAMEELIQYPWPGNNEQFYRVLQQLVAACSSDMLSGSAVHNALALEKKIYAVSSISAVPKGTLEEITKQGVQSVLAEEKMNKTKAAQRLGIGRTTLWRILGGDKATVPEP